MDDVRAFAECAQAADFIEKLSDGYDTVIGEQGVGLSGGQRQRIALARAVAKKSSLIILDDTTSAVDMETESMILKELAKIKNKTKPKLKKVIHIYLTIFADLVAFFKSESTFS